MQCACELSCVRFLATPCKVARQVPLSMEFSRQEYRSGLYFSPLGNLPDPGIEPTIPMSPPPKEKVFEGSDLDSWYTNQGEKIDKKEHTNSTCY